MEKQCVGIDLGRGFIKSYSNFGGNEYKVCFNSVYGTGRENVDYSNFDNPISLEIDGEMYFFGELAIAESMNKSSNIRDSKITNVAEKFLIAALSQIAVSKEVKIMLSVPNRDFSLETRNKIIEKYKGKTYKFKDNISGKRKEIYIADVNAMREADSALLFIERGKINREPVALISVGSRTTEFAFFDKGLKFINAKSTSIQCGSRDVNAEVRKRLELEKIYKDEAEIDISNNYDDKKKLAYEIIENKIYEEVEGLWGNTKIFENTYLCGGTSQNLNLDDSIFTKVNDPQLATAKGLYLMGSRIFNTDKKRG